MKISPFTVYNIETDQHWVCFENKYTLTAAAVFHKKKIIVALCKDGSLSLWDPNSSKVIKSICHIQASQLEISEDDNNIILLEDDYSIIILDAFSLKKLYSFMYASVVIVKVHTKISAILHVNNVLKVFNLNNKNHHETKCFPAIVKNKKYCIVPNLSGDKIYVFNIHGKIEIFKVF